jgi:hypothetical protein
MDRNFFISIGLLFSSAQTLMNFLWNLYHKKRNFKDCHYSPSRYWYVSQFIPEPICKVSKGFLYVLYAYFSFNKFTLSEINFEIFVITIIDIIIVYTTTALLCILIKIFLLLVLLMSSLILSLLQLLLPL